MNQSILTPCLAWFLAVCPLVVANTESAELVFKDAQYSFQTLRALGYSVSGGADVGEVLKTAYAIEPGNDESWYGEWLKTAQHCETAGNEFLKQGNTIGARREFLKASNYYRTACFAVERGYNVLLFEGPGQGEVIRVQKLPFRPDWEDVVKPVVDYAVTLKEVDVDRIALMGISLGGYLAPRAAAFEKRIMACIANGGVYDFHSAANLSPEEEKYLDVPQAAEAMDKEIEKRMKSDPSLRWAMGNGMFTFDAKSPTEWLRMTRPYNMRDAAPKISCPMLIVDSERDRDMPGQAKKLYAALKCPKDYLLFTEEDGAEEHCQMGALLVSNARILDWLDKVMAASRPTAR